MALNLSQDEYNIVESNLIGHEDIVWTGKPLLRPNYHNIVIILLFILFLYSIYYAANNAYKPGNIYNYIFLGLIILFSCILVISIFYTMLILRKKVYVITTIRVLIFDKGKLIVSRNLENVKFVKVERNYDMTENIWFAKELDTIMEAYKHIGFENISMKLKLGDKILSSVKEAKGDGEFTDINDLLAEIENE